MRQREAKTCCVMIAAMLTISSAHAQNQAVSINYGTVESVSAVQISTEQTDIREGDCVQVEQGQNANIRRTGSAHCESTASTDNPPDHHQQGADQCDAAKQELTDADTDDEVDRAVTKVRTLCDLWHGFAMFAAD